MMKKMLATAAAAMMLGTGVAGAFPLFGSTAATIKLELAKRVAAGKINSITCDNSLIVTAASFGNVDYDSAGQLMGLIQRTGLLDRYLTEAALPDPEEGQLRAYVTELLIEKGVECKLVNDPEGKAAAAKEKRESQFPAVLSSAVSSGSS